MHILTIFRPKTLKSLRQEELDHAQLALQHHVSLHEYHTATVHMLALRIARLQEELK